MRARWRVEPDVGRQLVPVRAQGVANRLLTSVVLLENSPARYLIDVRRQEIRPEGEPVLSPCQLDLLPLETVHDVLELLLRGRNQPQRPTLDLKCLSDSLKIADPVHAPGDVLSSLVDHENDALCPA